MNFNTILNHSKPGYSCIKINFGHIGWFAAVSGVCNIKLLKIWFFYILK